MNNGGVCGFFFFYRAAVNYFNMDSNGGASPGPQDHDMNESLGDLNEFLMRDAHVMTSLQYDSHSVDQSRDLQ